MPGRDRTGPMGAGPMTGGGFGDCATDPTVDPVAPQRWFGWGGRGWRHWFRATGLFGWQRAGRLPAWGGHIPFTLSPEEEADLLRNQAKNLKTALERIQKRLQDLETTQK